MSVATIDGGHWLNPSPASGHLAINQTANVAITINAATLKPQSYQGTLTFTYGGGLIKQVPVSLTVSVLPAPSIGLNQSSLSFTAMQGSNPAPLSFIIGNTGNAMLNWAITEDQNGATFAHLSATNGSLAPQKNISITVAPTVAQASAGTLTTNITVADSDAGSKVPKHVIAVHIIVEGQPQITLSTNALSFSQDNNITSSSQLLDISNSGSTTLNWTTQSSASWLTVDIPNGVLNPGKVAVVEVDCDSSALTPGTYTATLVVSDSGTAVVSQTLTVSLVVS